MAEKVTLRVSAAAAGYLRGAATREDKLKAARGEIRLSAIDLGTVLFFLSLNADPEIKGAALHSVRHMPEDLLLLIAGSSGLHPKIIDLLARLHTGKEAVLDKLLEHPGIEQGTVEFLAMKGVLPSALSDSHASPEEPDGELEGYDGTVEGEVEGEGADETSEEFQSKYKMCQQMGIAQKIKFALTGDKEWRAILIRESNKLVSSAVVKNGRITDAEILAIAKSKIQNDEVMRIICMNKEWTKIYPIRKALVENSKTPLPTALRFMTSLTLKDLASIAKSKNVTTVLSTQARRLLLSKKH